MAVNRMESKEEKKKNKFRKFSKLEEALNQQVIGQDGAVSPSAGVKALRADMKIRVAKSGSLLFLGFSPGVGKTFLARSLGGS